MLLIPGFLAACRSTASASALLILSSAAAVRTLSDRLSTNLQSSFGMLRCELVVATDQFSGTHIQDNPTARSLSGTVWLPSWRACAIALASASIAGSLLSSVCNLIDCIDLYGRVRDWRCHAGWYPHEQIKHVHILLSEHSFLLLAVHDAPHPAQ